MKPAKKEKTAASSTSGLIERLPDLLGAILLGLLVIGTTSPADTTASTGVFVVQTMMWMCLLAAVFAWLAFLPVPFRWTLMDLVAGGFLIWNAIATFGVYGAGDMRAALNGLFQVAAFVTVILIMPRLLNSASKRQDALTLMVALAITLAAVGLLQHFVLYPQQHAYYREHSEELLEAFNIVDPDSPLAEQARNRFFSVEPLVTFALTNSLASFLVPWMLLLLAAGWAGVTDPSKRRSLIVAALGLMTLSACLLLTKSRTAVLATAMGVGLLAITRSRVSQAIPWRFLAAGMAIVLVLALLVGLFGGLDTQVLTEAPLSVLYRLQYWQSTLSMIADHPLLGVGPGEFKNVYPRYKLPEASEEIGDPHNFLLEIAATAGLPALLLFAALLWLVFNFKSPESPPQPTKNTEKGHGWLLGGTIVGLIASPLVNWNHAGDALTYTVVLGTPLLVCSWLLRPLLETRALSSSVVPLAIAAFLLNLLASGGIGFPNVNLSLALLLGLAQPLPDAASAASSADSRSAPRIMFAVSLVLLVACATTTYFPVLNSRNAQVQASHAVSESQPLAAADLLASAAEADPCDPAPRLQQGYLELELAMQLNDLQRRDRALEAFTDAVRRNPRSYGLHMQVGDALLAAYRSWNDLELLEQAVDSYRAATERYPNYAFLHAKLAWAAQLAGDANQAQQSAVESLRLDELTPHNDRKLARYRLADPGLSAQEAERPLDELMRELSR